MSIFLLDCVKNAFKEFYRKKCTICRHCTLPWTISLLKTMGDETLDEAPCQDVDIANNITSQIHDFFFKALKYDIKQCRGRYCFQKFLINLVE